MLLSVLLLGASMQGGLPPLTLQDWLDGKASPRRLPEYQWTDAGLAVYGDNYWSWVDVETSRRGGIYDSEKIQRPYYGRFQPSHKFAREPLEHRIRQIHPNGKLGLIEYKKPGEKDLLAVVEFSTYQVTGLDVLADATNFQFSPDGRKIAYISGNNLWIADLAVVTKTTLGTKPVATIVDATNRQLTHTGSETLLNGTLNWVYWEEIFGRRDIAYWWSPDSKAIAFMESDQSAIRPSYFTDPREKDETVIKQYYPKAGTPNARVRLGVIETAAPELGTTFASPQVKWTGPDPKSYEYLLRVKWLPNGKDLALITMNRPQTDVTLTITPREGGPGRKILEEHDDAYVNVTDDLTFLDGGKQFLWASERSGYYHLYRYGIDGKLINAVTEGSWNLVSNPGPQFWVRQTISAVDEKNGWVYVTTNKDDSIQRQVYRAKLDGSKLERVTKERGVHGVSFSPDAKYFIDRYSNMETPTSLSIVEPQTGRRAVLAASDTSVQKNYAVTIPKIDSVTAEDAVKMPGMIRYPRNFDPKKKYPAIIYCYGGPSAPSVLDQWHDAGWEQVLCDAGYFVFVFDNRSAMAVGKAQESASLKNYMGATELNDLVRAARWLKKQPGVDPGRVGVWGWSNGGTYTLLGMLRSDEFKAGIAVAAVVDHGLYDSKWAESMMKTPDVNPEGFEEVRLDRYAKNLKGRLMLVHGTYDDNVHPQQLWRMVDALIDSNKQFDMMLYPMRKHGISDLPARKHLYTTMFEFWKRWL